VITVTTRRLVEVVGGIACGLALANGPFGETEHQKQCAVQLLGRPGIDPANHPTDTVPTQRDQFVSHDLGPNAESVLRSGFDQWPELPPVLQVRGNRACENGKKVSSEFIALNDNAGTRPAEIARNDHQHDIAARYFQDSQS
jgi:hypothetical protein